MRRSFSVMEGLHPNLNQLLASPIHWLLVVAGGTSTPIEVVQSLHQIALSLADCQLCASYWLSQVCPNKTIQNRASAHADLHWIQRWPMAGERGRDGTIRPEQPDTHLEP